MARQASSRTESTANLGFGQKLLLAADKRRNNMDAAEYKHVVLGLIFLKCISNSFEEHHAKLANRGIEADFGPEHADTFRRDLHPDLRADYVLADRAFNDSDSLRKDDEVRWHFGVPAKGNSNLARLQHFIHHPAPQGIAGFVLANSPASAGSSNQSGESSFESTFRLKTSSLS